MLKMTVFIAKFEFECLNVDENLTIYIGEMSSKIGIDANEIYIYLYTEHNKLTLLEAKILPC